MEAAMGGRNWWTACAVWACFFALTATSNAWADFFVPQATYTLRAGDKLVGPTQSGSEVGAAVISDEQHHVSTPAGSLDIEAISEAAAHLVNPLDPSASKAGLHAAADTWSTFVWNWPAVGAGHVYSPNPQAMSQVDYYLLVTPRPGTEPQESVAVSLTVNVWARAQHSPGAALRAEAHVVGLDGQLAFHAVTENGFDQTARSQTVWLRPDEPKMITLNSFSSVVSDASAPLSGSVWVEAMAIIVAVSIDPASGGSQSHLLSVSPNGTPGSWTPGMPVDADGDGIVDADDLCPATPAGVVVDASGCAESVLDGDGDGVGDDADQCADTPAGTAVDADGCPVDASPVEEPPLADGDAGLGCPAASVATLSAAASLGLLSVSRRKRL